MMIIKSVGGHLVLRMYEKSVSTAEILGKVDLSGSSRR
jgi:hypothetical protein